MIYSLNAADWICTVTLLRTGGFFEANPLMSPVMDNLSLGFLVKCILPAFTLMFVGRRYSELGETGCKWVDRCATLVLMLYTALCALHIFNFEVWRVAGL